MIDFLEFKENRTECSCKKTANSIQLLPNNPIPYVFYIGDFGDYNRIKDISIIDIENKSTIIKTNRIPVVNNGYLSLESIPVDDANDVVIRIGLTNQIIGEAIKYVYSIPIKISSKNACKTTRVNFKCLKTDVMQSISFPFWFWQNKRDVEIENYYQISTKTNISSTTKNAKYKRYQSSLMDVEVVNKLSDVLQLRWVYFDFKRVNQYEVIDIPELQADENFVEVNILVNEYKGIDDSSIEPTLYVASEQDVILETEINNPIITEKNGR